MDGHRQRATDLLGQGEHRGRGEGQTVGRRRHQRRQPTAQQLCQIHGVCGAGRLDNRQPQHQQRTALGWNGLQHLSRAKRRMEHQRLEHEHDARHHTACRAICAEGGLPRCIGQGGRTHRSGRQACAGSHQRRLRPGYRHFGQHQLERFGHLRQQQRRTRMGMAIPALHPHHTGHTHHNPLG